MQGFLGPGFHDVRTRLGCIVGAALLTLAVPAWGDLVILTNGREIRARVLHEGPDQLVLEVPYGRMVIPKRQVLEVRVEPDEVYLRASGERLLAVRDFTQGLRFLREAVQQNPASPACRQALLDGLCHAGRSAFEALRFQGARALADEIAMLAPEDPRLGSLRTDLERVGEMRSAAESAARDALAGARLEEAHERLSWLLASYPEDREAWRPQFARLSLSLGHAALRAQQFDEARGLYLQALTHEPDLVAELRAPYAYLEVQLAIGYLERAEFAAAVDQLEGARDFLPDHPALLYHLGLALEGTGQPSAAAELYARIADPTQRIDGARELTALRELAEQALTAGTPETPVGRIARPTGPASKLEVAHFTIHHQDPDLAREVARALAHHLARMRGSWFTAGHAPRLAQPISVMVHPDRASFEHAVDPPPWSDGVARQSRRYGLLVEQELHFDGSAPQFLTSVLPHELAHALLPQRMGPELQLPHWLDEGIATAEEPAFKQRHFLRVVGEALQDGTLPPLREVLARRDYPSVRAEVDLFYAQSNTLVRFLRERLGLHPTFELLRRMASRPTDEALAGSPFASLSGLERAYLRWLSSQLRP